MNMLKKFLLASVGVFAILVSVSLFMACADGAEIEAEDYQVEGIWLAEATWQVDNPYNYGGDTYELQVYFDFQEQGVVKYRSSITYNGRLASDTGWVVLNMTWSVDGNVISLSGGKKFVISDDCFNDTYSNPEMVLYFYKVE